MRQYTIHFSSFSFWTARMWLISLAVSSLLFNGCASQQPSSPVRQNGPLYIPVLRSAMVKKSSPPRIENKPEARAESIIPVPILSPLNWKKKACLVSPASPGNPPAGNPGTASKTSPGNPRLETPAPLTKRLPSPPRLKNPVLAPQRLPSPSRLKIPVPFSRPDNVGDDKKNRAMVTLLIPAWVKNREGWGDDVHMAFKALDIPLSKENVCSALAIIEQESNFKADPEVEGLPRIFRRGLEAYCEKFLIPKAALDRYLEWNSPDGRSYNKRINALRTERQMELLIRDMFSDIHFGQEQFTRFFSAKTAGPMQVSIEFAEKHVNEQPYPFPLKGSLRDEVFSRRGGVYFGIANLLDYPAQYPSPLYRFADFNAGHYSCRNAAFQKAVALLSKRPLVLDGDLLLYWRGAPSLTKSATKAALFSLRDSLWLSSEDINRDLRMEKEAGFTETITYQRVMEAADMAAGKKFPRQMIPEIRLKSPKIQRKLTTEWFAKRVEGRYKHCMERE